MFRSCDVLHDTKHDAKQKAQKNSRECAERTGNLSSTNITSF